MLLKDSKRVLMEISQTAHNMSFTNMPQKKIFAEKFGNARKDGDKKCEKMGIKNPKRWGYCRDVT